MAGLLSTTKPSGLLASRSPFAVQDVGSFLNSLAKTESGGKYTALGPVISSGMYKGDRAYGKYQVMGKNVPSWTKQYLGVSMTPQQFVSNPQAQDKLMAARAQELYNKYGNWEDVASIHFTGQPAKIGATKKDQLGTTGAQYIKSVTGGFSQSTPSSIPSNGKSLGQNFRTGLNTAAGFVGQLGVAVLQAPGKAVGSALALTEKDKTFRPQGLLQKVFMGAEPITNIRTVADETRTGLEAQGYSPNLSNLLTIGAVGGGAILDLSPFGGSKNAAKAVVAVKTAQDAALLGRKLKIADELLPDFITNAVKINDLTSAEKYLQSFERTAKNAARQPGAGLLRGTTNLEAGQLRQSEQPGLTPRDTPQTEPRPYDPAPPPSLRLSSYESDIAKLSNSDLNVGRLKISSEAEDIVTRVVDEVKPAIEDAIGKRLSNAEAVRLAEQSGRVLTRAVGRDQTLEWQASMLRARQALAAASESGTVDEAYIRNLLTIKTQGTDIARKLQSLSINAEAVEMSSKEAILDAVLRVNDNIDDILRAAKDVDFNDLRQATEFYRTFIKPTGMEWLDLIRYNSMLSSPKTHIVNIFSNLLNSSLVAPIEKALTGGLDFLGSKFTGKERRYFAGEGGAYAANYFKSTREAAFKFAEVMRGNRTYTNLDTRHIPISTKGVKGALVTAMSIPTRLLEGMDQFFMTLGKGAETGALNYRQSKLGGKNIGNIETMSQTSAEYRLFRQKPLNENQGHVLDAVDQFTTMLLGLRASKNPLAALITKFTVPFVQTPMNIFKQGIEFSPAGLFTLWGAKNKTEQLSKAIIGSAIFTGSAILLASDRLTWGEPTDPTMKAAFKAAGKQAYSVKIGDTWYSYQKLPPPVAFPLALVAGIHDARQEAKMDDSTANLILSSVAKWGEFLADQSYAKSIGDILSAVKGGEAGIERIASNYAQQLVPYRALGGWLAKIFDDTQRKVDNKASFVDKQVQLLMMNIPGLSQKVPARLDGADNPILSQHRLANAFSPVNFSSETPMAADYEGMVDIKKINRETTAASDEMSTRVDEEYVTIKGLTTPEEKKAYLLNLAQEDPELAEKIITKAKEQVLERTPLEEKLSNSPVATRAKYIFQEIEKLSTPEEKKALLLQYAQKKILTEDTLKELVKLMNP